MYVNNKKEKSLFIVNNKYYYIYQNVLFKSLSLLLINAIIIIFLTRFSSLNNGFEIILALMFFNHFNKNFIEKEYNVKLFYMYRFFKDTKYIKYIDYGYILIYSVSISIIFMIVLILSEKSVYFWQLVLLATLIFSTFTFYKIKFSELKNIKDKIMNIYITLLIFLSELILYRLVNINKQSELLLLSIGIFYYLVIAFFIRKKFNMKLNYLIFLKAIKIKSDIR
jgi:hypothetical protein